MSKNYIYSDLNRKYTINGEDVLNTDINAINQSIENILTYSPGDKLMNPRFGSRIRSYLMEPMNSDTADNILTSVLVAISEWEPRVKVILTKSSVVPRYSENRYDIIVSYKVIYSQELGDFRTTLKVISK